MTSLSDLCSAASATGNPAPLDKYLSNTSPNAPDEHGMYPIHYTSLFGIDTWTRILISRGAMVDVKTPNGTTPLVLAIKTGHLTTTRLLLEAGADVNITDNDQNTPLDIACRRGFLPIVECILMKSPLNIESALNICCEEQYTSLIRVFVDRVPVSTIIRGLGRSSVPTLSPSEPLIERPSGDFPKFVDVTPYKAELCDYSINSTPPMEEPYRVHACIVSAMVPYLTLVPSDAEVMLSGESLLVMLQYCYTQSIANIMLSETPIKCALEILSLSCPQRLGTICSELARFIAQELNRRITEMPELFSFFMTPKHRLVYSNIFSVFAKTLIRNVNQPEVDGLVMSIDVPFLNDILDTVYVSSATDVRLPNYRITAYRG